MGTEEEQSISENDLILSAANLLTRKRRRKKKSKLSLYQSRQTVTKEAKYLRRRNTWNVVKVVDFPKPITEPSSTEPYGCTSEENEISDDSALATPPKGPPPQGTPPESTLNGDNMDTSDEYVKSCYKKLTQNNILEKFLKKLDGEDCLIDFMTFVNLIINGNLSVCSLPFLLLLDVARFLSCNTTTQMRYRVQTKQFWEAVYRFGGGAMIRLFSGMKNFSQVVTKKAKKSLYDPLMADINFAVPDINILSSTVTNVTEKIKCGFIQEIIDKIDRTKEYNLCVDGKKISPGCSGDEGDIYLFGFEGPPSLEEQNKRLKNELDLIDKVLNKEMETDDVLVTSNEELKEILQITTKRIMDQRITQVQQELLKMTFQKTMEKDSSTIHKFTQAIASIDTCQIFSCDLVHRVLQQNTYICHILAKLNGNEHNFCETSHVNLEKQGNCATLVPPNKIQLSETEELLPQYTKQGSQEWLDLRKQAPVTSSTAYGALGLDTQKKQREIFQERILGREPQPITPEMERMFKHGRDNEIHAFGTMAAIVLPALFPKCRTICQVGSFFLDGDERDKLVVVSPDAVITNFTLSNECRLGKHGSHEDMGVEFKCPMGDKKYVLPVHYKIPRYYVVQVLLQMRVLEVGSSLYGSYSKYSMVVLLITFDDNLWKMLWSVTKKLYDKVTIRKLIKTASECKVIKEHIDSFIQNNCKILCEVAACTASEGSYKNTHASQPFRIGIPTKRKRSIQSNELKVDIIELLKMLLNLVNECHEMERRKATELVMWILSDTNRIFDPDSFYALPVAYVLKGYSLDVNTMRKMMDIVLNKLKEEGVKVLSQSFDGQWHNLAVKGHENKPLTKLQLQKKVWNSLGRKTKENLLRQIDDYSRVRIEDLQDCSNSVFLTVGQATFGNLHVSFQMKGNGRSLYAKGLNGSSGVDAIMTKIHSITEKDRPDIWRDEIDEEEEFLGSRNKDIMKINDDTNVLTLLPQEFLQNQNIQSAMEEISDIALAPDELPDISPNLASAETNREYIVAPEDEIGHSLLNIHPEFLEQILVGLCSERRSEIWNSYGIEDLYNNILRNQKQIEKMTSYELDIINNVFYSYKNKFLFRCNDLKAHKVKIICKLFGRQRKIHKDPIMNTKRITLRKMCLDYIKDIDYPTMALAVSLANTFHLEEKAKWEALATAPLKIQLPNSDCVHESFSYPEYVEERDTIECKLIDPTHILTNIRTHVCTKGYKNVKRAAFIRVSEKDNNVLNRAYIVNLVDKQSAAIAQKFFSSEVQAIMMDNGDMEESDFVGLIRKWYEAVDERGIPVPVRLDNMQSLFDYLSALVKFDVYPPKSKYVAGIPIVTFEVLLQNISTRIQMYALSQFNSYNHRSISTLIIETFYSLLSRMEGSYNGCPKSTQLAKQIRRIVRMIDLQQDPFKIFSIHLSHRKKYPESNLMSEDMLSTDDETHGTYEFDNNGIAHFHYKPHAFDRRIKRSRKKRVKNVDLGMGNKPLKREGGVREHFKAYDSKIKSTTRHGLRI